MPAMLPYLYFRLCRDPDARRYCAASLGRFCDLRQLAVDFGSVVRKLGQASDGPEAAPKGPPRHVQRDAGAVTSLL